MSDAADEDLLNGEEFDGDEYDIANEEEDALLEDEDKDYEPGEEDFKRKKEQQKKDSVSETDDQEEDVLNLDIEEEDFQVEDKDELTERKKEGKFVNERTQPSSNITITARASPKPQVNKRPCTTDGALKTQDNNVKKVPPKFDNRRKRGIGRGNFQQRSTFNRNNMQVDRRPGRRNARLAWDNPSNYNQNNNTSLITPWAPGNTVGNNELNLQNSNVLLKKLVDITYSQPQNLLQLPPPPPPPPPPVLNFEPPPNIYQNQQPFQPVSNIPNLQPAYNNQNQVPPLQPPFLPYHPTGPQQFYNQPPPNNYNYYNNNNRKPPQNFGGETRRCFTQTNYNNRNMKPDNLNDHEPKNKNTFQNNFSNQEVYRGNTGFNAQNTVQNKSFFNQNPKVNQNPNYNNYAYENRNVNNRPENYSNNFVTNNYQQRNMNQRENFNREVKVNYNYQNTQNRNDQNITNQFVGKKFRVANNNSEVKTVLPEKKMKTDNSDKQAEQSMQSLISNKKIIIDEEEDEEMRLYRLKIEEQKRQREKVLKMKEERRRMMLLQQKKQEEESASTPLEKSSIQENAAVTNRQKMNYQQRPVNQIPVLNTQNKLHLNANSNLQFSVEEELPNLPFKFSNNLQRKVSTVEKGLLKTDSSSGNFLSNRAVPTTEITHPKKDLPASNFMSDRVVVVKSKSDNNEKSAMLSNPNPIIKTVSNDSESADVGPGFSSFFNNRKVLKKDNTLINTRLVVINNLSASTTQAKLVEMSRGIGEIQKLQMEKQERQATILFKSVASAHAFFKKYRRYMLDLSMIQVKLEPML